jgi:uncharacterized protein
MMKTFVVNFTQGAEWVAGKTSREQPFWDEHAAYLDTLQADGHVLIGGPYADYTGVTLIMRAASDHALRNLLNPDPFIQEEILKLVDTHEWLVFMGADRLVDTVAPNR